MAEEFQVGGGGWWGSSRARFEGGTTPSSSSGLVGMGSYGWPAEIVDLNYKAIPSSFMNSVSASASTGPLPFQDMRKLAQDPNLQMMGLGLSSHAMDWNQTNSRHGGEKAETRFVPGLQQNTSFAENFDQQELGMESWRQKLSSCNSEANGYKQFSPNFHSAYGSLSSTISSSQATALGSENQPRPNLFYPANYGLNSPGELSPSLLKLPHYLRNSPPKQQARFSDVAPSWNTSSASMNDAPSSTFFPPPTFEKPKNKSVVRDVGKVVTKKSSSEASNKRSRSTETPAALPPFKVRKEKMGDRITALQQLVSPFGKTDTASVLSEAIEYIKFLHEQVNNALINPYMKSGASVQHHLSFDKSRDCKGPKQNLRSRGLCLVPISSTFPITCETPVDFWSTPSYGATLR